MIGLKKYILLLTQFVSGEITAIQFEKIYLKTFLKEEEIFSERVEDILNDLFFDVEDYCQYPDLRDEGDLDEEGLLRNAKNALDKLI